MTFPVVKSERDWGIPTLTYEGVSATRFLPPLQTTRKTDKIYETIFFQTLDTQTVQIMTPEKEDQ